MSMHDFPTPEFPIIKILRSLSLNICPFTCLGDCIAFYNIGICYLNTHVNSDFNTQPQLYYEFKYKFYIRKL